jgi:antitoxin MazE
MRTQIAKWGNSLAVRLPRKIAEQAGVAEGSSVELQIIDGQLRVIPARPIYAIDDLLAGITDDNLPDGFDDRPRGAEVL